MATCPVCGGVNFEKHAGYLYCMECQTQSQEYHEQEYEMGEHSRMKTSQTPQGKKKKPKKTEVDIGTSTSWDIFNHILYGMTHEVIALCNIENFDTVVLQLWACYLNRLEAAFTSTFKDNMPKLRFYYRKRDAKVLYNFDTLSICSSKKSSRLKRSRSKSVETQSSSMNDSKYGRGLKKKKIVTSEYQEQMSSQTLDTTLADETIESLGRSDDEISLPVSDEVPLPAVKECFTKDAYESYKLGRKSPQIIESFKREEKNRIQYLTKSKLLAIINLSLLLTNSDIYLSDLLRFIREGHLSYAKVTHFLPRTMKVLKNDFKYIETSDDNFMPAHSSQRKHCGHLAVLLNIEEIAYPDLIPLLNRYCKELKLPDQVRAYGTKILKIICKEDVITFKKGKTLPNFEGIAMAAIIFVLKFYFGLDDKTERVLSDTARVVNRFIDENENELFIFEDWQKYIECRKTIIKDFHYPTQEQFSDDCTSSKKFIEMLMKETKDEFKNERTVIPNKNNHLKEEFLTGVKDVLTSMSEEKELTAPDFNPSQTPQESYLKTILEGFRDDQDSQSSYREKAKESSQQQKFPWKILSSDFSKCNINFGVEPDKFTELLENEHCKAIKLTRSEFLKLDWKELNKSMKNNAIYFIDCSTCYWIKPIDYDDFGTLNTGSRFKLEIFSELPSNFQWLFLECARLTEMTVIELYRELRRIEYSFTQGMNFKSN